MKFLIFSDESGRWNTGKYYIRSWIRITPENYDLLRKEIIFSKHETGVKELKWRKFKNNYVRFKNIFSVGFDIFITISKPDHFQSREYDIVTGIENLPNSTGGRELTYKIKTKITNSVKNQLFFNYFEKVHIENSRKALLHKESPNEYKYIIDTPQYLDREWENIAMECGIQQIEIIKISENIPGIELAGIVSGCIMDLLENKEGIKLIYKECIKPKMWNMMSQECPNPNFIFFPDFSSEEITEMNIFR
jgi:hypothetical protein